jgi:hypothetical protein
MSKASVTPLSRFPLRLSAFTSRCAVAVLTLLVLFATSSFLYGQSQASTGQIAGVVRDQGGAVVPGAEVRINNVETGFSRSLSTDADGLFRFVLLPPGTYTLTANAKGFAEYVAQSIPVEVGRTFDLNPTLSVGAAKESITVAAEGVEVTRNEPSAFVNLTQVQNMPLNGRRFQDLVNLTPSAQTEPSRSQISIAGQRGINTNVTVDGLDYNQPFFGGIRGGERSNFAPTIPQDAIQEFQVVEAGYSAEFGRSTAGLITAVTKSGTNSYHGSGFYLIRPKELTPSTEYYDTVKATLASKGLSNVEVAPAPTQQQWGASVGGPIKTDKLFFFGSYNQQRVRATRTVFFDQLATFTPTTQTQDAYNFYQGLQGSFPYTNDYKAFLGKLDYQFKSNNRLNLRYSYSDNNSVNGVGVGALITPTTTSALSNNGTEQDNLHTVVGQLTSFWGNFANDLRGQYSREERPRPANAQQPTFSNTIGAFGTVSYLGQNIESDWRLQFADSLTMQKGAHTVKLGFEYNHLNASQLFGFNQNGAFGFNTTNVATILRVMSGYTGPVVGGVNTAGNLLDDSSVTYLRQIGNLQAAMTGEQVGAFAQDSWRLRPNFTVNYGLRWEGSWNPQPEATNTTMVQKVSTLTFPNGFSADPTHFSNQLYQFAPRLGFAWDPFKDGKTAIRGYSGVYYASTPLLLYAGPVNNFRATPGDLSLSLPFPVTGLAGSASQPCSTANPVSCKTLYQQFLIAGIDLNNYTLGTLPILSVQQIQSVATALGYNPDPFFGAQPITMGKYYHNPTSYQAGFGVEREVAKSWTVGMDFNWIHTVHLQRNRELNLPTPIIRTASNCPGYTDPAERPFFGIKSGTGNCGSGATQTRPITSLGSVQIRQDTAKSLYRGLTLKSVVNRKRYQVSLYYTLAETVSDDDNERDSGGQSAVNTFDMTPEYGFSNLDRRHQFVAAPLVYLPWGFEVSSSVRIVSGAPLSATQGSDLNLDNINNDRPYWAAGVPFTRNSFRNLGNTDINLRIQKAIKITESKRVYLSSEFFNAFNLMNLTYSSSTATNYCATTSDKSCGFNGPTNTKFMQLRDPATGALLTSNNTGGVMQVQFGAKFEF